MYFLRMMTACPNTFPAVDTELAGDSGFAVTDPDSLGRAAFDTVNAAFAETFVKVYRMKEFCVHSITFLSVTISRSGQS